MKLIIISAHAQDPVGPGRPGDSAPAGAQDAVSAGERVGATGLCGLLQTGDWWEPPNRKVQGFSQ